MIRKVLKKHLLRSLYKQSIAEDEQAFAIPFWNNATFMQAQSAMYEINPLSHWVNARRNDRKEVVTLHALLDTLGGNPTYADYVRKSQERLDEGSPLYLFIEQDRGVIFWRKSLYGVETVADQYLYNIRVAPDSIWRPARND